MFRPVWLVLCYSPIGASWTYESKYRTLMSLPPYQPTFLWSSPFQFMAPQSIQWFSPNLPTHPWLLLYSHTLCLSVSNPFSSAFKIYGESILSYSCPTAVYSLTAARWIFQKPKIRLHHEPALKSSNLEENSESLPGLTTVCNLALPTLLTHPLPLPPPQLHWFPLPQSLPVLPWKALALLFYIPTSSCGCFSLVTQVWTQMSPPQEALPEDATSWCSPSQTLSQCLVLFY